MRSQRERASAAREIGLRWGAGRAAAGYLQDRFAPEDAQALARDLLREVDAAGGSQRDADQIVFAVTDAATEAYAAAVAGSRGAA